MALWNSSAHRLLINRLSEGQSPSRKVLSGEILEKGSENATATGKDLEGQITVCLAQTFSAFND